MALVPRHDDKNRRKELKRMKENPYKYPEFLTPEERRKKHPADWKPSTKLVEIPGKKQDHLRMIQGIEERLGVHRTIAERVATYMVAAKSDDSKKAREEMIERGVWSV